MAKKVNTVCGPIDSDKLGKTLDHEHLLYELPMDMPRNPLDNMPIVPFNWDTAMKDCIREIKSLKEKYGLQTIWDATPRNSQGRNVSFYKAVSEATGVNIIAMTGHLCEWKGDATYLKDGATVEDAADNMYNTMKKEITEGIDGTGIKAGIIKMATGTGVITPCEEAFFKEAAKVSAELRIPIITHTSDGTMAREQADLLIESGADPKRVCIGHLDGNSNLQYYLDVLSKGVYISIDRIGLQALRSCPECPLDSTRALIIVALFAAGYGDRIMISNDAIIVWVGRGYYIPEEFRELNRNRDIGHALRDFVPELKKLGMTDEQLNLMLVENPKQFLRY